MQIFSSKYFIVIIILFIILLSFKFGGEQNSPNKSGIFSGELCSPNKNFSLQNYYNKNTEKVSNLISNCDFAGIDEITLSNSNENSHQLISQSIESGNITYRYSAGQLYTLIIIESFLHQSQPSSYLCFLEINIPENFIHKGTIIVKYKKSMQSNLINFTQQKNMRFKVIAYRQSSYLRNIDEIYIKKRQNWNLQNFINKYNLYLA